MLATHIQLQSRQGKWAFFWNNGAWSRRKESQTAPLSKIPSHIRLPSSRILLALPSGSRRSRGGKFIRRRASGIRRRRENKSELASHRLYSPSAKKKERKRIKEWQECFIGDSGVEASLMFISNQPARGTHKPSTRYSTYNILCYKCCISQYNLDIFWYVNVSLEKTLNLGHQRQSYKYKSIEG